MLHQLFDFRYDSKGNFTNQNEIDGFPSTSIAHRDMYLKSFGVFSNATRFQFQIHSKCISVRMTVIICSFLQHKRELLIFEVRFLAFILNEFSNSFGFLLLKWDTCQEKVLPMKIIPNNFLFNKNIVHPFIRKMRFRKWLLALIHQPNDKEFLNWNWFFHVFYILRYFTFG